MINTDMKPAKKNKKNRKNRKNKNMRRVRRERRGGGSGRVGGSHHGYRHGSVHLAGGFHYCRTDTNYYVIFRCCFY